METAERAPLWTNLKKEYIDDNFRKLQSYLKDCTAKNMKDSFDATTIGLLRQRVADLVGNLSE